MKPNKLLTLLFPIVRRVLVISRYMTKLSSHLSPSCLWQLFEITHHSADRNAMEGIVQRHNSRNTIVSLSQAASIDKRCRHLFFLGKRPHPSIHPSIHPSQLNIVILLPAKTSSQHHHPSYLTPLSFISSPTASRCQTLPPLIFPLNREGKFSSLFQSPLLVLTDQHREGGRSMKYLGVLGTHTRRAVQVKLSQVKSSQARHLLR